MKFSNKSAFAVIEVLLAIAVFVMSATSIIYLLVDASSSNQQGKDRFFASTMAEVGLEAARNIRDSGWTNLTTGNHGIALQNGKLAFAGASDTDGSGRFTRQVSVSTVSADKMLVTSTVSWRSPMLQPLTISFSTFLENWSKTIALPASWDKPTIISTFAINAEVNDIFSVGNYVFLVTNNVAGSAPEFFIVDAQNPAAPNLVGSCDIGDTVNAIYVAGNYAYLATNSNSGELTIVNISNPTSPQVAARVDTPGSQNGLSVFALGNYAYIGTEKNYSNSEFYIYDVTDPQHPSGYVGKFELNANGRAIYVSGDFAYVGTNDDSREIIIINISSKTLPKAVQSPYNNPGSADVNDLFVNNGTIYFVTDQNGSSNPNFVILYANTTSYLGSVIYTLTGQYHASDSIRGLAPDLANNQIFLATQITNKEFTIMNIANPAAPTEKTTIDLPDRAVGVTYNGAYAFVADAASGQELIIIGPGQ